MKKTAKEPVRRGSQKGKSQNVRKSTANVSKTSRKHKKNGYSDAVRAFLLAGVLVVFSAFISMAVIVVRSTLNDTRVVGGDTEFLPSVSIESGLEQSSASGESANTAPPASEAVKTAVSVSTQSQGQPASTSTAVSATNDVQPARNIPAAMPQSPPERPVENLGTLVFMIDDAGNNLWELEPFLRLPGPLTIAVLPGLPHSAEAARRIRAAGKEVFLHQPMEAIGAQDPGPGAIYSGMSADEIRSILRRNIAEIGPVAGINNHQGSKITMDREAVETILIFCAENGLLFLDSRTTAETTVPIMANRLGIKIGERDVFLDNEQDKESMLRYIMGGLSRAQRNGSAVMIGHTWSPELAPLLAEQFPILTGQGYTLKTASDIIR
jgi:polysaccharide deacetylase 2 family uncharacterized protein YibQ